VCVYEGEREWERASGGERKRGREKERQTERERKRGENL
jgi:hypothetical protein